RRARRAPRTARGTSPTRRARARAAPTRGSAGTRASRARRAPRRASTARCGWRPARTASCSIPSRKLLQGPLRLVHVVERQLARFDQVRDDRLRAAAEEAEELV